MSALKTGCVRAKLRLADASRIMSDLQVLFLLVLEEEGDPAGLIDGDATVRSFGEP